MHDNGTTVTTFQPFYIVHYSNDHATACGTVCDPIVWSPGPSDTITEERPSYRHWFDDPSAPVSRQTPEVDLHRNSTLLRRGIWPHIWSAPQQRTKPVRPILPRRPAAQGRNLLPIRVRKDIAA